MVHCIFIFYMCSFLHSQNIYIIGWGQRIKLVGSKIHVYVSVHWRHLKSKTKVVRSSVMLFTVYNTMNIHRKVAKKGAPHL